MISDVPPSRARRLTMAAGCLLFALFATAILACDDGFQRCSFTATRPALIVAFCAAVVVTGLAIAAMNGGLHARSRKALDRHAKLMEMLAAIMDRRDSDISAHNYRVALYSVRLAEVLGFPHRAIPGLLLGAFLHDIGKIGIPDTVLLKKTELDRHELAVMRTHVSIGVEILSKATWPEETLDVVEYHHERVDGLGYPQGIAGDAIPLPARIFSVVDIFDALTSKRAYKGALPFTEAMDIVRSYSGNHLDPALVTVFCRIASPLYAQIGSAEDKEAKAMLWRLYAHYASPVAVLPDRLHRLFRRQRGQRVRRLR